MSDINIPGVTNNKINTRKMIDAIMDVERVPFKRMESEMDSFKKIKKIWQELNLSLTKLDDSAKNLFSYNSSFYAKKAVSSNESVLTATATRKALVDEKDLIVKRIATTDRFMSDSVGKDFTVKAGTYRFVIGEKEISLTFHGGSLTEFAELINKKGGKLLRATVVNNTKDTQVLVIESLLTGKKNRLRLEGDALTLAEETGMMKKTRSSSLDVSINKSTLEKANAALSPNTIAVEEGTLTVKPTTALNIPIAPPFPLNKNMILEYEVKTSLLSEEEIAGPETPPGPTIPETGSIEYKGIKIYSEKSIVILPEEKIPEPPRRVDDLSVLSYTSNGKKIALPALKDSDDYYKVSVPIGETSSGIDGIVIENRNTHRNISVRNISITDPTVRGDYSPTNPLSEANDAVIEYNGIDIIRETNTIDDLVPEVTLSLHEPSDEKVKLSVKYDTEAMKESIITFVGNYNRLITDIDILTRSDSSVIESAGYLNDQEKEKALERLAAMKGDITLIQLKSNLQTIMMNAYKTSGNQEMALLVQMGISTNMGSGIGIDKTMLRGYLQINEDKLDGALQTKPELVRELFGNDLDGDLIIDSGVAFAVDSYVKQYVRTGGVIATRLQTLNTQMSRKQQEIVNFKRHLEDYERDLRRKYGQMEGMIEELEKSNQQLKNLNPQNR